MLIRGNSKPLVFLPSPCTEAVVSDSSGENKGTAADVSASQHIMVCALKELGSLVQSLSATAAPLIQEPSIGEKEPNTKRVEPRSYCVVIIIIIIRTPALQACWRR